MQVIRITNSCIKHLINSLVIEEETRLLFERCILQFSASYVNFLYDLFYGNEKLYQRLLDSETHLGMDNVEGILGRYASAFGKVNANSIYVVDKFDLLYSVSYGSVSMSGKISNHVYEDFYCRLEDITDSDTAMYHMEAVFESIDVIMSYVETLILRKCMQEDNYQSPCLSVYSTIHADSLLLAVI